MFPLWPHLALCFHALVAPTVIPWSPADWDRYTRLTAVVHAVDAEALERRAAPATCGRQRATQWCWAATMQMALTVQGLPADQAVLAALLFGAPYDLPAWTEQMAMVAWRLAWPAPGGDYVRVRTEISTFADAEMLARNLRAGRPPIAMLRTGPASGHAYLVSRVAFLQNAFGRIPDRVTLRDPWPWNPTVREVTWAEYVAELGSQLALVPYRSPF